MTETRSFLYEKLNAIRENGPLEEIPSFIEKGLSDRIVLRDYQREALQYFITYVEGGLSKNKQIHTLFHMATGSGKTVIMAGLILYLYTRGYRNFLFFVNQTNILEKTKENFLNASSNKYLFADSIEYLGDRIKINSVENFSGIPDSSKDINICFTTTQQLHLDLDPFAAKENSLTEEDFENHNVVFISDESHHVNSATKKKLSKDLESERTSWEQSVMHAFHQNRNNVLLEFTATCDLKNKYVLTKYRDKIVYNYPLIDFRRSGYTKDFQNFATDGSRWQRALMAIIMSEYRRYLFADEHLNIKPVVLFKSTRVQDSEDFYDEFFAHLKNLSPDEIRSLSSTGIDILNKALAYFEDKDDSFALLIHSLQDGFSEDKAIIVNEQRQLTEENQLRVNSLEDKNNPIRCIFAVDKLNEGWDVLNLFDIVRLYEGRKSKSYTIKEAQLIGRGARYCPFQIDDTQELSKRKYDRDLGNPNRVLETMYFHSTPGEESKYIQDLHDALVETGMEDPAPITLTYELKESFKETDFYKRGYIFSNKRVKRDRLDTRGMDEKMQSKVYQYTKHGNPRGKIRNLFGEIDEESNPTESVSYKFKNIPYNILSGAAESCRELRFSVLKEKYPLLNSTRDFLTNDDYLGRNTLVINYDPDETITARDIFEGLVQAFAKIATYIVRLEPEYQGTAEFTPHSISKVIRNKTIHLATVEENGGHGVSQNNNPEKAYKLDLTDKDWYVYNDNYGTSEEKLFIKDFDREIAPKLENKGVNFFLIRNERIPDLAIYSFANGNRFEPDFLLFVEKKGDFKDDNFQVYIEPKGTNLLEHDAWKENFLLQMAEKAKPENAPFLAANNYKILGLPFFNNEKRKLDFDKAFTEWIDTL